LGIAGRFGVGQALSSCFPAWRSVRDGGASAAPSQSVDPIACSRAGSVRRWHGVVPGHRRTVPPLRKDDAGRGRPCRGDSVPRRGKPRWTASDPTTGSSQWRQKCRRISCIARWRAREAAGLIPAISMTISSKPVRRARSDEPLLVAKVSLSPRVPGTFVKHSQTAPLL
jgi:hypothetical protein